MQVVIELSDEQKADKKRYYNQTHDLIYNKLNHNVFKAFLSAKKHKPNKFTADGEPVHYSFSHLCKYHNAGVPNPQVPVGQL